MGRPLEKKYILRKWKDTLKLLKIEYRSFHKTRHTFITQMALYGVPEVITQTIVGHKKGSEITHNIYTHINSENTKAVLNKHKIIIK